MAYEGLKQVLGPLLRKKIRTVAGEKFLPKKPPFILAGNHVGYLDGLVLASYFYDLRKRYVTYLTTEGMWRFFGKYLSRHWLKMVPIVEHDPSQKAASLGEAVAHLKRGEVIGIFPEGTRNPDGQRLLKGKTGAVRLALLSGAPVIPFGLQNNTGHRIGEALRSLWKKDRFLSLRFGPPLDFSRYAGQPIDKPLLVAATTELMGAIAQLCGKRYEF